MTWPDGTYTIAVNATGANGQPVTVSTQVQGVVTGVNHQPESAARSRWAGRAYPISAIQSISNSNLSSLSSPSSLSSLNNSISNLNSAISNLTQFL